MTTEIQKKMKRHGTNYKKINRNSTKIDPDATSTPNFCSLFDFNPFYMLVKID